MGSGNGLMPDEIKPLPEPMLTCHQYCSVSFTLTDLSLDKMGTILADKIFNCISLNENDRIWIQIPLKYIPRSPVDNNLALVQVLAWHRTGNKPLPGPMMTHFIDAYMRH